jgi:hypothetical protein
MVLGSELVFLGRSAACGVRIDADSASRTHCVLVRSRRGAYVVDLVGRGTWLNGRPLRGASALADGDSLMIGSARFEARIEPPWIRRLGSALVPAAPAPAPAPTTELIGALPPPPPGLLGADGQATALAWMMQVLQAGQDEILRQQAEFQQAMAQVVRQMHQDNTTLLARHLDRVDAINRELSSLRDEIRHRFGPGDAPATPRPAAPALPPAPPLRIAPTGPPPDPAAATAWLLDRVGKLEQEGRSSWRDLLGRLGGPPARRSS